MSVASRNAAVAAGTSPRVPSHACAAGDQGWANASRASAWRMLAARASSGTRAMGTSAATRSGRRLVIASTSVITSGSLPRVRPDRSRPICWRDRPVRSARAACVTCPWSTRSHAPSSSGRSGSHAGALGPWNAARAAGTSTPTRPQARRTSPNVGNRCPASHLATTLPRYPRRRDIAT
jgi:hypothetical protein